MNGKLILSLLLLAAGAANSGTYQDTFENSPGNAAQAFFERALKADHKDHQAYFYLGRLAMQDQDFDQAIDQFDEAIDLEDGDYRYHYWYAMAHIANVSNVNMFRKMMYAKRMRSAFERAVELKPDHLDSLQGLFRYYTNAPSIAGGDLDKAREIARTIGKLDLALGLVAQAELLQREEKPEQALATFGQAVAADPDNIELHYRYVTMLVGANQAEEGAKQIDLAAAKATEAGEDRLLRLLGYQSGKAAAVSGKLLERGEKALLTYLQEPVEKGMPGHDWATFRLAQIHHHQGQTELARSTIKALRRSAKDEQLKDQIEAFLDD